MLKSETLPTYLLTRVKSRDASASKKANMAEHDARHDSTITKTHGRCNLEKLDFSIQLLLGFTNKWSALSWSKTSICILYMLLNPLSVVCTHLGLRPHQLT